MKDLFVASTVLIDIQSILKLFVSKREVEEGPNEKRMIDSALCDFQKFLTQVDNGQIEDRFRHVLTLRDVLFSFTGFDRIPAYGMPKLIDVKGVKNINKFRGCIRKYLVTLNLIIFLRFC